MCGEACDEGCGAGMVNSTACANKAGLFAQAVRLTGGPRP
jgi:hypothetical protein